MAPDGTARAGVPWRSRTFHVVLASTVLMPTGVRLLSPVLPLVAREFAVTDVTASLIVSAYFLPGVFLSPLLGAAADRFGRRSVLVPCLLVFGLAGTAIGLLDRFPSIVGLRLVQGTAAAGVFVVTVTMLADAHEGTQRSQVLGVNTATLFLGATVYPLVGGALATRGWNVPFFLYVLGVPVCAFALIGLRESSGENARGGGYVRGAVGAVRVARVLPLYVAAFAAEAISFGAILTALPFLLAAAYGLPPIRIGAVVTAATVAAAVSSAASGRLSERASSGRLVAIGFLAYGGSLLGIWLAPGPASTGIAAVVFGVGWGLVLPSVDVALSGHAPPEFRAGVLSLRNSATFLGRTVGPVTFTGAAVAAGYRPVLLGAAVVSLAAGVTAVIVTKR